MEYYIGQIVMFAFGSNGDPYPPTGFLACDGSLVSINQYSALYSLIWTTYGGDGNTNFALPDLRGVFPSVSDKNAVNFAICYNGIYPSNDN